MTPTASEPVPVLSVTDRGRRMTTLLPGRPVGRWSASLTLLTITAVASWALVSCVPYVVLLGLAPDPVTLRVLDTPGALVAAAALAVGAATVSATLHRRVAGTFGQRRVGGLSTSAVISGGWAVGAVAWTIASHVTRPTPAFDLDLLASSPTVPRELGVCVGAVALTWTVVTVLRLGLAVDDAAGRQRTIERLRLTGTRHAGEITSLRFENTWLRDQPLFTLRVSWGPVHERHEVDVAMRTTPTGSLCSGHRWS